jgi:hypothetical protein
MKKTYIQPEVKEIKINLPAILAADSLPGSNGYTLSDDNNIYDPTDPAEEGDGSDGL